MNPYHSIQFTVLKDNYKTDLDLLFSKINGNKTVIWDDSIAGCFDLITDFSTSQFKQKNGVEKMFLLQKLKGGGFETDNVIFIVKPQIPLIELVAQIVSIEKGPAGPFQTKFHLIFVPRHSLICELKLKELEVHSHFSSIEVFCLDLIPFDTDLLSMELNTTYRQCYLEGDLTPVYSIAKAIMSLQALYGIIPHLHAKGDCAFEVLNLLLQMRLEFGTDKQQIVSQIDHLLILDRTVDSVTPLLTQLTYEGLIDEFYGISNCVVRFPIDKFPTPNDSSSNSCSKPGDTKKFILNSSDELFCELRDQNINAVGPALSRRIKSISALYDKRNDAKTVSEMKQFVADLPVMQAKKSSLANHTTIAELIKEVTNTHEFTQYVLEQKEYLDPNDLDKSQAYIEDAIVMHDPLTKVLRLICLQCYCNGGFKPKVLEFYKREIIQTYGYQHLLSLHNLEKVGLIRLQTGLKNFPTISKSLHLIAEKVDEQNPTDISYVYSGYAPLSVKLAQILHQPGWRKITEVLQMLPGKLREETQQINYKNNKSEYEDGLLKPKTTLVFIIGGITFAEISALRFLSQMEPEKRPSKFVIASTNIINGTTFIESLMEDLKPRPYNPF